jgi:polyhydroxybutyrate depolymerase
MKKLFLFYCLFIFINSNSAQINSGFTFESINRTYIVYLPTSYTSTSNMPLVFVLHGFTQTANGIMSYSGFNAIAEANKFIAVYPNGTGTLQSWNANIGIGGVNDLGFLHALLDTMLAKYSINATRVFACGFSNGGFMSNRLACQSTRFKAIAGVGGTMTEPTFNACNPTIKIPVLQIHGTADAIVAYGGTVGTSASVDNTIAFWNGKNNCPTTYSNTMLPDIVTEGSTVERFEYKPCSANTEVQLLKVINGGHQWPGATGISGLGNLNMDINASQEIWNFFNKFGIATNIESPFIKPESVNIYPNPATNYIEIENTKTSYYIIQNMQEQIIQEGSFTGKINIQQLPIGIYTIAFKNQNKQLIGISKLVKK